MSNDDKKDVSWRMTEDVDYTNPNSQWDPQKRKTPEELENERISKERGNTPSKFSDISGAHELITGGIFIVIIGFFLPFGILFIIGGLICTGVGASKLTSNQESLKLIEEEMVQEVDKEKVRSLEKILQDKIPNSLYFPKGGFTNIEVMDSKLYSEKTIKSGAYMYIGLFDEKMLRHSLIIEYKTQGKKVAEKKISSLYEIKYNDLLEQEFYMTKKLITPKKDELIRKTNDPLIDSNFTSKVLTEGGNIILPNSLSTLMKKLIMEYKNDLEFSYIDGKLYIKVMYRYTVLTKSKIEALSNFNYTVHFKNKIDMILDFINS